MLLLKIIKFIKNYYRSLIVALIILLLTTISGNNFNSIPTFSFQGVDKIAHFIVFFVFAVFLLADLYKNLIQVNLIKTVFIIFLITLFYGGMIELVQHFFIPFRTGSIYDLIANLAGSLAGCYIQTRFRLIRF